MKWSSHVINNVTDVFNIKIDLVHFITTRL